MARKRYQIRLQGLRSQSVAQCHSPMRPGAACDRQSSTRPPFCTRMRSYARNRPRAWPEKPSARSLHRQWLPSHRWVASMRRCEGASMRRCVDAKMRRCVGASVPHASTHGRPAWPVRRSADGAACPDPGSAEASRLWAQPTSCPRLDSTAASTGCRGPGMARLSPPPSLAPTPSPLAARAGGVTLLARRRCWCAVEPSSSTRGEGTRGTVRHNSSVLGLARAATTTTHTTTTTTAALAGRDWPRLTDCLTDWPSAESAWPRVPGQAEGCNLHALSPVPDLSAPARVCHQPDRCGALAACRRPPVARALRIAQKGQRGAALLIVINRRACGSGRMLTVRSRPPGHFCTIGQACRACDL